MARAVELERDDAHFEEVRDRLGFCIRSMSGQRKREIEDISFEDGQQWDASLLASRGAQGSIGGAPATPARPTLVINGVREPIRQVLNAERAADLGIEITPAEDFGDLAHTPGDDGEIELREGLVRRIQRESKAAIARSWAYKRAVTAGEGFYLVNTRYLPGRTMDQEVYVGRIYNQNMTYLDPSHEMPDGSDAEYEFMGTWMEFGKFTALYPEAAKHPQIQNAPDVFADLIDAYPDWYQEVSDGGSKKLRSIFVVSYWSRSHKSRPIVELSDGRILWADEPPEDATAEELAEYLTSDVPKDAIVDTRTVDDERIMYEQIAGGVVRLDKTEWPSPFMPIVKVVGEEVLPYDGEKRAEGMVRPARDAAKAKNYMISKFVEQVGLTPIPTIMVDPDAISGYESHYAVAATRALPYLPYRSYDDNGRAFNPPTHPQVDPNIYPMAQGVAMFDQAIQSTTGGSASERVGAGKSVQSARAINQLQQEDQFNTSNFLDNLRISVEYEAQIINSLLYPIYGKPGRLVRILTAEGDKQAMRIGQPTGPQDGGLRLAPLTKDAKFNVAIKVTKNFDTRRQQAASVTGEMIDKNPQLMTWFGDIYFKNADMPGHQAMAKRAKAMLDPRILALIEADERGGQVDPATLAKMAQMQDQLKQAEVMIQELAKKADPNVAKLQVEQLNAQRDLDLERLRADVELRKAQMDNAAKIRVAEIQAETKGILTGHQLDHEAAAQGRDMLHEAAMQAMSHEHEAALSAQSIAEQSRLAAEDRALEQSSQEPE